MMHPKIEEKTRQYTAWLDRANHVRPLVGVLWEPDIPPLPELLEKIGLGCEMRPEDVDPAMFLPFVGQCYQLDQSLPGDGIQPFSPAFGIPWMEALAGCPAVCQIGSIWAHPFLEDLRNPPRLAFDPGNPWFRALAEFTSTLAAFADGRFPVALPQMRGPLDILAAMCGPERMCVDLIEQPQEVQALLDALTSLWIDTAQALLSLIPPFAGGYCSRMKMWAPGETITPQNDASSLISPKAYAAFQANNDRRIFERFPYSCFHMHSTEYRHIPTLLAQPALTCIEFTLEHNHGGLALEPSLEAARTVLANKPLVLAAPDPASADICRDTLPPEGLCLLLAANEPTLPEAWVDWVQRNAI
jgi:hypothetical protein